jgi:hypothetical protein
LAQRTVRSPDRACLRSQATCRLRRASKSCTRLRIGEALWSASSSGLEDRPARRAGLQRCGAAKEIVKRRVRVDRRLAAPRRGSR